MKTRSVFAPDSSIQPDLIAVLTIAVEFFDDIVFTRALEAFGVTGAVTFTLPFWAAYVAACRAIDDATGYGMRAIDRALWQWSKDSG